MARHVRAVGTMFRQDMQAWGELVRTAGITPD
jgi:hypothetical protein